MRASKVPLLAILVAIAGPSGLVVRVGSFFVTDVSASITTCKGSLCPRSSDRNIRLFANREKNDENESEETGKDPVDVESARKRLELLMGGENGRNATAEDGDAEAAATVPTKFSIKKFLAELPSPPSRELDNIHLPENDVPMSSMERVRRENEIVLLKLLEDSDEASEALWNLWYSERGKDGQRRLAETDLLMGNPQRWDECESLLVNLIDGRSSSSSTRSKSKPRDVGEGDDNIVDEYIDPRPGIYFVEAVNRLATLYFLQQRLNESYKLCRIVLQLKPWHFGALSGIVQVCIALGRRQDETFKDEAREWAELRLPSMISGSALPGAPINPLNGPSNPRRIEWCRNAVEDAKKLLRLAEKNTKQSLGKPEDYYSDSGQDQNKSVENDEEVGKGIGNDMDDDAWQ